MCIYTHGSRVFIFARVNVLSLAARLTTVSLDIYIYIYIYIYNKNLNIKTHGSESRGQEEAACMRIFWPTQPLQ